MAPSTSGWLLGAQGGQRRPGRDMHASAGHVPLMNSGECGGGQLPVRVSSLSAPARTDGTPDPAAQTLSHSMLVSSRKAQRL